MALFRRRSNEANVSEQVSSRPLWSDRLGHLGGAIDGADQEVRDLAIILEGGPEDRGAMLSLLGHRQSVFHSGWTSLMYRLDSGTDALNNHATGFLEQAYSPSIPPHGAVGPWRARLNAIGALIDDRRPDLRSPSLIVLSGGVVINGVLASSVSEQPGRLISFELSDDEIRAKALAVASAGPAAPAVAR
jgi:hypothetical protein